MIFNNVMIESYNQYLPENIITSEEIESKLNPVYQRLKLPQGRLELMTGIKNRRHWQKGTTPSHIASCAAKNLLENSFIDKSQIDLLIHSSVCRDFLEPSTASVIHNNLELDPKCMIFDLSNACLGMLNSFVVAANMIETGAIKRALIVSGENGGPLLEQTLLKLNNDISLSRKDIKRYIANLTIGSGGVAFTLCHKDICTTKGHQLLGGASLSDTKANHLCKGDGNIDSLMMETNSEELLKHGIELAKKTLSNTLKNLNLNRDQLDYIIGHQVGSAHEEQTMKALELENKKTITTYQDLGNTGSAALPLTFIKLKNKSKVKEDDIVLLLGIGSGLSSLMLGVKW